MSGAFFIARTKVSRKHEINVLTKEPAFAIIINERRRKMAKAETRAVGFRTPIEIYEKLVAIAKEEDRTVSYIVNRIIREALKDK